MVSYRYGEAKWRLLYGSSAAARPERSLFMDDLRLTDERLCVLDVLVEHKLSIMRDENTTPSQFRQMVYEISMIEVFEATRDLPTDGLRNERRRYRP